jgi:hypothetical protein
LIERRSIIAKPRANSRSNDLRSNVPKSKKDLSNDKISEGKTESVLNEDGSIKTKQAFMKKDKLPRTPPNDSIDNN